MAAKPKAGKMGKSDEPEIGKTWGQGIVTMLENFMDPFKTYAKTGSTISTLLHDRINPKDCQVLSLGDSGFLQFFRVVSRDYGTPRKT